MDDLRALFFGEVRPDQESERALLRRAFDFAARAHDGQLRKDGSPYFTHPVAVATDLWNRYGDAPLAAAGLLHDVPEDCPSVTMADVYREFGQDVGFMVDAVTKDAPAYLDGTAFADKIEKLLWGGMKDVRCLLLKIADRDHNLQTIGNLKENKQIRMAFETQAIYQPLRKIFGLDVGMGKAAVMEMRDRFSQHLQKNSVSDPSDLKTSLCNTFFRGFDHDTFQAVYSSSDSVNWKIEDKRMYARLVDLPEFDQKVDVLSVKEDETGRFWCLFRYRKGEVFEEVGPYLSISSFRQ